MTAAQWLQKMIDSAGVSITHVRRDDEIILAASTKELQAFVLRYAEFPRGICKVCCVRPGEMIRLRGNSPIDASENHQTTDSLIPGANVERERNRVCPVELAPSLDSKIRRWLQNPNKIVAPYVKEGMTVLDVGCGPGFFSIEMAKLVGPGGKVISADMQEGMLQKLGSKIRGTVLDERIKRVKCDEDKINVSDTVDFILAFYMVHEVPDKNSFFRQLRLVLREQGQFLLVEPKLFHVSRTEFETTVKIAEKNGFKTYPGPGLPFSWSAVLKPV